MEKNNSEQDKFISMTINGVEYFDKQQAGEKILEECKKVTDENIVEIGEYKGFKMELEFNPLLQTYRLYLKNNGTYFTSLGESDIGNITRIENTMNELKENLDSAEYTLESHKTQLEKAKSEFGKPFIHEEELNEKTKRLNKVNSLLKMDEKTYEIMDEDEEIENDRQVCKNDYER